MAFVLCSSVKNEKPSIVNFACALASSIGVASCVLLYWSISFCICEENLPETLTAHVCKVSPDCISSDKILLVKDDDRPNPEGKVMPKAFITAPIDLSNKGWAASLSACCAFANIFPISSRVVAASI